MGVEVFQCHTGNSLRKLFARTDPNRMFIQVDDSQGDVSIKGNAYICNEEGKLLPIVTDVTTALKFFYLMQ